jgi:mevalonate kinase
MLSDFPAKILLLGEYTVLSGSKALALPYHALSGKWSFDKDQSQVRTQSRESLNKFIEKSGAHSIDLQRMKFDFSNGLWFNSSIPQGYGLGSSGAVIAAIYEKYGDQLKSLLDDKKKLADLESFFHGSSSGIDPLVSFIKSPLLIHNSNEVEILTSRPHLNGFFLLNTGRPRQTGPLVSIYQEKMKDPQFKLGCANILAKEVNFAIDAVLKNNNTALSHHLWHISKFQWDFFPEMIPTKERSFWTRGLESGDYILKLCGAGGGGFILGHSQKLNIDELTELFEGQELRTLSS